MVSATRYYSVIATRAKSWRCNLVLRLLSHQHHLKTTPEAKSQPWQYIAERRLKSLFSCPRKKKGLPGPVETKRIELSFKNGSTPTMYIDSTGTFQVRSAKGFHYYIKTWRRENYYLSCQKEVSLSGAATQIGHYTLNSFKKCEGRLADLTSPRRFKPKLISRCRLLCPQLLCSRWIASIVSSDSSTILWHEQDHQQLTSQNYIIISITCVVCLVRAVSCFVCILWSGEPLPERFRGS